MPSTFFFPILNWLILTERKSDQLRDLLNPRKGDIKSGNAIPDFDRKSLSSLQAMVAIKQVKSKANINRKVDSPCTLGLNAAKGTMKTQVATVIRSQTGAVKRKKNKPKRAGQLLYCMAISS